MSMETIGAQKFEGVSFTPRDMDGSLFIDTFGEDEQLLAADIIEAGHSITVIHTSRTEKAPFFSDGRAEVYGEVAVRNYLKLQ